MIGWVGPQTQNEAPKQHTNNASTQQPQQALAGIQQSAAEEGLHGSAPHPGRPHQRQRHERAPKQDDAPMTPVVYVVGVTVGRCPSCQSCLQQHMDTSCVQRGQHSELWSRGQKSEWVTSQAVGVPLPVNLNTLRRPCVTLCVAHSTGAVDECGCGGLARLRPQLHAGRACCPLLHLHFQWAPPGGNLPPGLTLLHNRCRQLLLLWWWFGPGAVEECTTRGALSFSEVKAAGGQRWVARWPASKKRGPRGHVYSHQLAAA